MTWKEKRLGPGSDRDRLAAASDVWHVDAAMSARYASGDLSELAAWSLEKHVEACGRCAAAVSSAVRTTDAASVLDEVRASVLAKVRASAPVEARASVLAVIGEMAQETARAAEVAAGGSAGTWVGHARRRSFAATGRRVGRAAWAVGPALRGPWIVALVLVCAAAVGLAYRAGYDGARPLLLTLAPVLPLLGVALSYGPGADPMYEITAAAPSGGLRLLLTRAAVVLAVSLPVLTAVGAVLPGPPGAPGAAAWLLPGLALVLAALALGSYVGCRTATGIVAACWTCAVLLPAYAAHGAHKDGVLPVSALAGQLAHYLSGAAVQGGWAAAGALCAGLLVLRRHAFDFGPGSGRGRSLNRLETP